MRVLHVLRSPDDARAIQVARDQAATHEVALLLLQAATAFRGAFPGAVYACRDDIAPDAAPANLQLLDYDQIVALMVRFSRVIAW
ncbi:MAG: hypothetical protein ACYC4L_06005 [Chloroflexota bacterium]